MVFVELGIEALLCACVDACKRAPSRFSHSGTNVRQAIRERHSTPRLRDPVSLHRASIVLTDPQFDMHEARGPFLTTQPRAKGQHLLDASKQSLLQSPVLILSCIHFIFMFIWMLTCFCIYFTCLFQLWCIYFLAAVLPLYFLKVQEPNTPVPSGPLFPRSRF